MSEFRRDIRERSGDTGKRDPNKALDSRRLGQPEKPKEFDELRNVNKENLYRDSGAAQAERDANARNAALDRLREEAKKEAGK